MKNAARWGGASDDLAGWPDRPKFTRSPRKIQDQRRHRGLRQLVDTDESLIDEDDVITAAGEAFSRVRS